MGSGGSTQRLRTAFSLRGRDALESKKILVLGCMGAGKSTLCRMLAKSANATICPCRLYKHTVENNLLEVFKVAASVANQFGINTSKNAEDINILINFRHKEELHSKVIEAMRRLAKTPMFTTMVKDKIKSLYLLPYNMNYFLQNYERIIDPSFDPSELDVTHAYSQTVGTNYQSIRMGPIKYELLELPGHHIFRRIWSEFYVNTNVIIFVIDLSDICRPAFYNNLLQKGHLQDKVRTILSEVVCNQLLSRTAFILLFNKRDLLEDCASGFNFAQLGASIRTWESAEKWYSEQCLGMIPPTHHVYTHSLSLIKKPDLNSTLLDSLSQIFRSNKDSFDVE